MADEEEKVKELPKYELVEVSTAVGLVIQAPDKSQLSDAHALVEILNKLDEIHKIVG